MDEVMRERYGESQWGDMRIMLQEGMMDINELNGYY